MIIKQQLSGRERTLSFAYNIMVYRQGIKCDISGATINCTKGVLSWFSQNNHIANSETTSVKIGGHTITREASMSYLGVTFVHSLCFRDHIDQVIAIAHNALSILRIMADAKT
uniref:Uncharacterized protein n=1 Tax=Arion vulgaris TaxID=1028688 RepID=A0A0B7BJR6_9EUPU